MDYESLGKLVVEKLKSREVFSVYRHIPNVTVKTFFSECGKYRYWMDISLAKRLNKPTTVCVIMQNPSVANSDIADKSIQFLEKLIFTRQEKEFTNVGRMIVVNLYAFIQTNEFIGLDECVGSENDKHIQQAIDDSEIILVAWGKSNQHFKRHRSINAMIKSAMFKCAGNKTLLKGKVHPSRASYENYILEYTISE